MVFWGVEVKPGKPYTHAPNNNSKGRLHVSQATMGTGAVSSTENGVVLVQCNVGSKSPVYLCALSQDKLMCSQVNVEFEESDEVVFSVIGARSVHLVGYYLRGGPSASARDDESESYGEDIAESETQRSVDGSDEDEYEDSFIDDGEPEVMPPSPLSSDGEDTLGVGKTMKRKGSRRRLKKKYQSSQSNDAGHGQTFANRGACVILSDGESDDKFPILSLIKSKPSTKSTRSDEEDKSQKELFDTRKIEVKDDANCVTKLDERADASIREPGRQADQFIRDSIDVGSENGTKLKKKIKKQPKGENPPSVGEDDFPSSIDYQSKMGTSKSAPDLPVNEEDQKNANVEGDNLSPRLLPSDGVVSADVSKSKKKKKKKMEDETKNAFQFDSMHKSQQDEAMPDMPLNGETQIQADDSLVVNLPLNSKVSSTLACSENSAKPKRKRKQLAEEKTLVADNGSHDNAVKEDNTKQDEFKAETLNPDLSAKSVQSQKEANFMTSDNNAVRSAEEDHSEKKKRRKKRKIQEKSDEHTESMTNIEHKNFDDKSPHLRTSSNGLIVEDLEMGKPDSKIAVSGKKVIVRYTGKLKENGRLFDSNIDVDPLKFRLGKGEVLKGLDVGVDGMRVGDKRRLTIPPSLGYGNEGDGKDVPPDSWLVYDVELLKVR